MAFSFEVPSQAAFGRPEKSLNELKILFKKNLKKAA
jgi:hypothetical protein